MSGFNKVFLLGNLTRDWDLRFSPKGTPIANGSIAVNRRWRDQEGEEKEEVVFVTLNAFGKTAETLAEYTHKGDPLFLDGRLKLEQWEDKRSGENRQRLTVVVESFQFIGTPDKEDRALKSRPAREEKKAKKDEEDDVPYNDDSDVPFSAILELPWRGLALKWNHAKKVFQMRFSQAARIVLQAFSDG